MAANGMSEAMAERLPPSMTGEPTPASLVNGQQSGYSQEPDGQAISSQDALQKLQDNVDHGAKCVAAVEIMFEPFALTQGDGDESSQRIPI